MAEPLPVPATAENIERAAHLLRAGELVCFPTETVYGVGANALDARAVARIFEAKGRPSNHPLIVHLPAGSDLGQWAMEVPEWATDLIQRYWPGPLTLVLRRSPRVPPAVTGGQETVALRVPAHPVALALLERFGSGIAAPSANRFGRISPTRAVHAASELGTSVAMVLDGGPTEVGIESTIVDLSGTGPRLLRPGGIPRRELEEALGVELTGGGASAAAPVLGDRDDAVGEGAPETPAPRAPGTLPGHYAPSSALRLLSSDELEAAVRDAGEADAPSVMSFSPAPPGYGGRWLEMPGSPPAYAQRLYSALHELDELERPIHVERPPASAAWEAVLDRLVRASHGSAERSESR